MSSSEQQRGLAAPVLVTGASGFVGSRLMAVLGERATPLSLRSDSTTWPQALQGVGCVVHLAARVHMMHEVASNPLREFRRVNVGQTLALANMSIDAGVKRFVFISSAKVNGEYSAPDKPFRPDDVPAPNDPYAVSKWEAEQGLRALARQTGMEVVIIRPPLVYGPGVKANFASMVRWLRTGLPLPLGAIDNRRSLLALDNLVDFILTASCHPAAANETFMVCDGEDVSIADLLRRMALAMNCPARLVSLQPWVLNLGAKFIGRQELTQRLCANLQVDMSATRVLLNWRPPLSLDDGLSRMSFAFKCESAVGRKTE